MCTALCWRSVWESSLQFFGKCPGKIARAFHIGLVHRRNILWVKIHDGCQVHHYIYPSHGWFKRGIIKQISHSNFNIWTQMQGLEHYEVFFYHHHQFESDWMGGGCCMHAPWLCSLVRSLDGRAKQQILRSLESSKRRSSLISDPPMKPVAPVTSTRSAGRPTMSTPKASGGEESMCGCNEFEIECWMLWSQQPLTAEWTQKNQKTKWIGKRGGGWNQRGCQLI